MSGNGWETQKRKDKDKTRNEVGTNHHCYLIRTLYSVLLPLSFPRFSSYYIIYASYFRLLLRKSLVDSEFGTEPGVPMFAL